MMIELYLILQLVALICLSRWYLLEYLPAPNAYYRINWYSKITGFKSHGSWLESEKLVDDWIKHSNRSCGDVHHYKKIRGL
jgi:hypothetical protein